LVLLLAAATPFLEAHPHIWIDSSVAFRFTDDGLAGFTVTWVFDDMNSAAMIELYDTSGDRRLDEAEVRGIRTDGFEHLYKRSYFLQLKVDGRARKPETATDFQARVDKGLLVYSFFVPLKLAATARDSTVTIAVMDDTWYVDFRVPEGGVASSQPRSLEVSARAAQQRETSPEGWVVNRQEVRVQFRRRAA